LAGAWSVGAATWGEADWGEADWADAQQQVDGGGGGGAGHGATMQGGLTCSGKFKQDLCWGMSTN